MIVSAECEARFKLPQMLGDVSRSIVEAHLVSPRFNQSVPLRLNRRRNPSRGVIVKEMQNRTNRTGKTLELRLIGAFSMSDAPGKLRGLPGRKDRAVLAFLAAHPGRRISRDRLVELIWPGAADGAGRASLRQSLSTIRKALSHDDVLSVDRDTVTLNPDHVETDLARLVSGTLSQGEEALAPIANGEMFLDDIGGISAEFDSWRATEQAQLSRLVADRLRAAAQQAEAAQDHAQVVKLLMQLASLDPLNEEAVRQLMQAMILTGQPNAAIQRYRAFEDLLKQELGVRPERATQDLLRQATAKRAGSSGAERTERPAGQAQTPAPGDPPSIMVLPFRDLSEDREGTYFADGLTEDITIELGRFPALLVLASETGFEYRDAAADDEQIARETGARYILSGSVRRTPQRLRVSVQLSDTESRGQVWAERFDRVVSEVFALQDDITAAVVGAVAPQVEIAEQRRAGRGAIPSMSLYDRALKAQFELNIGQRTADPGRVDEAVALAEQVLDEDPGVTQALLVVAWGQFYRFLCRWPPDPEMAKELALQAANALLAIESGNVHALTVRGEILTSLGEYERAMRDYSKALDLNPNFTWNLFFMSICEALIGKADEAREHAERGLRLSPKDREIGVAAAYLALALAGFSEEDFPDAVHWAELSVTVHPTAPYRRILAAASYGLTGKIAEGREHLRALEQFAPGFLSDFESRRIGIFQNTAHDDLLRKGLSAL